MEKSNLQAIATMIPNDTLIALEKFGQQLIESKKLLYDFQDAPLDTLNAHGVSLPTDVTQKLTELLREENRPDALGPAIALAIVIVAIPRGVV